MPPRTNDERFHRTVQVPITCQPKLMESLNVDRMARAKTNETFNVTLIAIDRRIDDVLKLDLTQSFVFGLF